MSALLDNRSRPVPLAARGRRALAAAVVVATAFGLAAAASSTAAASAQSSTASAFASAQSSRNAPKVVSEMPVTAGVIDDGPAQNSPTVVADPTEPRFVVLANRLDAPDYSCALQLSGDGGRSWIPAQPVTKLPAGAAKCYAPEVAFDRSGVLHFLFVGLRDVSNEPMGIFLSTSANRGRSFTRPREILAGRPPGPRFGVRMAIDVTAGGDGRMHVVWLQATSEPPLGSLPTPPNPVMAAYSDDGGRTFSKPVQVSDPRRERVVAPKLTLGPDHAVHVLYYDLEEDFRDYQGLEGPVWEGTWSLVLASSLDGGERFGPSRVVDDDIVPTQRVLLIFTMPPAAMAAGPSGSLFVAWPDGRNGDWDVLMRRSTDGGRTWAKVVRLNDDPPGNGRHQYLPALSVAPDGRVDAVFADRRNNPDNVRNEYFYTYSTDGGRRFSPNVRISGGSSDTRVGPTYAVRSSDGLFEFGGRLGLLSRPGEVVAAWTDTRNAAGGPTNQEIFSAVVDLPGNAPPAEPISTGGGGAGWLLPVGVGAGGAALAALAWRRGRRARTSAEEPALPAPEAQPAS